MIALSTCEASCKQPSPEWHTGSRGLCVCVCVYVCVCEGYQQGWWAVLRDAPLGEYLCLIPAHGCADTHTPYTCESDSIPSKQT
jgi:hypothetical protein